MHHLAAACQRILHEQPEPEPRERERNGLQLSHSPQIALDQIVNALVTELAEPVILVLDDYHLIDRTPDLRSLIERLLGLQPRYLHIVLATRRSPTSITCRLPVRGAKSLSLTQAISHSRLPRRSPCLSCTITRWYGKGNRSPSSPNLPATVAG